MARLRRGGGGALRRRRLRHRARGRAGGRAARGAEGRRARLERRDPAPGSCRARPRRAQGGRLHADHDHGRVGPGREHHGRPNGGGRHPLLPVLRRGGGNRFAHLRVRARRRRQGHRRPLYQIVEGEPQGLHHCALRGLGRVLRSRRDGDGEGRRPAGDQGGVDRRRRWQVQPGGVRERMGRRSRRRRVGVRQGRRGIRPVPRGMGGMGERRRAQFRRARIR